MILAYEFRSLITCLCEERRTRSTSINVCAGVLGNFSPSCLLDSESEVHTESVDAGVPKD